MLPVFLYHQGIVHYEFAHEGHTINQDYLNPKMMLKGRFQTVEDIITNTTNDLKVTQQTSYEQCFHKRKRLCKGTTFKGIIFNNL
jgi:hypothetical protein